MHSAESLKYIASVGSNIAFQKYWGRDSETSKLPSSCSLSMTLLNARTEVSAESNSLLEHRIFYRQYGAKSYVNLTPSNSFAQKGYQQLDRIQKLLGKPTYLDIYSSNSFPAGAGIASSASSMGALTLAACCSYLQSSSLPEITDSIGKESLEQAVRLGSGSACRSLYGGFVQWLRQPNQDQAVVELAKTDHWQLADTIVLVSTDEKKVSSTEGHKHAQTSPLFSPRIAGCQERRLAFEKEIKNRNLKNLGPLIEAESLEMHGIMLSSTPRLNYLTPESSRLMAELRLFRQKEKVEAYFTLDAGANVHIIHPLEQQSLVCKWLEQNFGHLSYIQDQVGPGPILTTKEAIS